MRKNIHSSKHSISLLLVLLVITIGSQTVVFGQDDTSSDSTLSPELKKKLEEAKARKEIAEARKAELEALVPLPDPESLRTSTEFKEIKGEFIENRILAYKAMEKIATQIACRSRGQLGKDATLVIYRTEEWTMVQNYLSMTDKQKQLLQWYEELIKEAEKLEQSSKGIRPYDMSGGAFPPILGILGNLAALFQRKESYTPTLFDIADKELIAVFFDRFQNAQCTDPVIPFGSPRLFYPGLVPISTNSFNMSNSDLWNKVVTLETKRKTAESKIQGLENDKIIYNQLKAEVNQLRGNANRTPEMTIRLNEIAGVVNNFNLPQFSQSLEELKFKSQTLKEFYKGFLTELGIPLKDGEDDKKDGKEDPKKEQDKTTTTQTTTVNVNVYNKEEEKKKGGGGGGNFFSYLEAEKLYKLMNDPKHRGYWVQMSVTKAGGNVRVVSIPIVDIFAGSRVRFSGGAIINYTIFDLDGSVELSGIIPAYEEYTSSKKIKKSIEK